MFKKTREQIQAAVVVPANNAMKVAVAAFILAAIAILLCTLGVAR
jgi:hypothetical protein